MNYFPKSFSIWLLSSTNSAGAIRCGAIGIGSVPSTKSIENSTSLLGGNPSTSFGNIFKLVHYQISYIFSSFSTSRYMKIMKHWAPPCISFITPWDDNNSGPSELGNTNFFSWQSIRMRLAESQSIPKITSNSYRGRHIRFTLYTRPSTSTGHLTHKDDVLTKLDARVDTTRSHCSSQTDRPNLCTQVSDTKEYVALKSYNTHTYSPTIIQQPMTRLPEPAASSLVTTYTLPVAWGKLPCLLCWFWARTWTRVRVAAFERVGQSLPKWPSFPQLLHLLKPTSWGQTFLMCSPPHWYH